MRPARYTVRGVAMLMALLAVAVMGLVAAHTVQLGAQAQRRLAEDELLHAGQVWRRALRSWVDTTPGQASLGPRSFDDLLRDPRVPGMRRHLRQVPFDPLTGSPEWGVQRSPDGQIIGIYSLAQGTPVKRTGFAPEWAAFDDAKAYASWVFAAGNAALPVPPPAAPPRPTTPPTN